MINEIVNFGKLKQKTLDTCGFTHTLTKSYLLFKFNFIHFFFPISLYTKALVWNMVHHASTARRYKVEICRYSVKHFNQSCLDGLFENNICAMCIMNA